jgi:hypothetical protein
VKNATRAAVIARKTDCRMYTLIQDESRRSVTIAKQAISNSAELKFTN